MPCFSPANSLRQERYVNPVTAVAKECIGDKSGQLSRHEDYSCLSTGEGGYLHVVNESEGHKYSIDEIIIKVPDTTGKEFLL